MWSDMLCAHNLPAGWHVYLLGLPDTQWPALFSAASFVVANANSSPAANLVYCMLLFTPPANMCSLKGHRHLGYKPAAALWHATGYKTLNHLPRACCCCAGHTMMLMLNLLPCSHAMNEDATDQATTCTSGHAAAVHICGRGRNPGDRQLMHYTAHDINQLLL